MRKRTEGGKRRIGLVISAIGIAVILLAVGLAVFESRLTAKSERNRQALEQGRTPIGRVDALEREPEPEMNSEIPAEVSSEVPSVAEKGPSPSSPVENLGVDVPKETGGGPVSDSYSVYPLAQQAPANNVQPDGYAETGKPLDQETMDWYAEIRAEYPDFKGWVELPYWEISYPIFVNDEDPLKYERMTRDGEFSYLGEVNYQGDPVTSDNLILFGHSLYDMSGFSKIDNLPEEDLASLDPRALEVWIDLYDEGVRRSYLMVNARYHARADIEWAYTDFGSEASRMNYIQEYAGLSEDPGQLLTLATCVDAVGDWKAIIHCVPIG